MDGSDHTMLVLALILFFGLVVPKVFRRTQLSFISILVILGSLLGPNGIAYVEPDDTMRVFAFLGAAFHMLLAGFETETEYIKKAGRKIWILIFFSTTIPFITGLGIVKSFGFDWNAAIFMGVAFMSSSIILAFFNVNRFQLQRLELGKTIKSLVVIQELGSALIIFLIFKNIEPHQRFSLPILLGLLISSVAILRMFLPEIVGYFFQRFEQRGSLYESRVQLMIALLLFVIVLYSALDVHPIIAAFLVGFTLADTPYPGTVRNKLHTMGYGFFIPIYLFIIGMDIDLKTATMLGDGNYLVWIIIAGALASKYLSSHIASRLVGFSRQEAVLIGVSSSTKLTVTLSSAYVALNMDLIQRELYTAIILVAVITTLLNPPIMQWFSKKLQSPEDA